MCFIRKSNPAAKRKDVTALAPKADSRMSVKIKCLKSVLCSFKSAASSSFIFCTRSVSLLLNPGSTALLSNCGESGINVRGNFTVFAVLRIHCANFDRRVFFFVLLTMLFDFVSSFVLDFVLDFVLPLLPRFKDGGTVAARGLPLFIVSSIIVYFIHTN